MGLLAPSEEYFVIFNKQSTFHLVFSVKNIALNGLGREAKEGAGVQIVSKHMPLSVLFWAVIPLVYILVTPFEHLRHSVALECTLDVYFL